MKITPFALSGTLAIFIAFAAPALADDARPATQANLPITKDMAYAPARKALLEAGWRPLEDLSCLDNVYGGGPVPKDNDCVKMPELSAASGDGHVIMNMMAPDGKTLRIFAYGDLLKWDMPGEESALTITEWEVY